MNIFKVDQLERGSETVCEPFILSRYIRNDVLHRYRRLFQLWTDAAPLQATRPMPTAFVDIGTDCSLYNTIALLWASHARELVDSQLPFSHTRMSA